MDDAADRTGIIEVATTYLDALISHDAESVLLADDARRIDNARVIVEGADDLRSIIRREPVAATSDFRWLVDGDQAIVFYDLDADMAEAQDRPGPREDWIPAHIGERFQVRGGRIEEIEVVYSAGESHPPRPARLPAGADDPATVRAVAQAYVAALVSHDAAEVPVAPEVWRIENGRVTADGADSLRASLESEIMHTVKAIDDERWYVDGDGAAVFLPADRAGRRRPDADADRGAVPRGRRRARGDRSRLRADSQRLITSSGTLALPTAPPVAIGSEAMSTGGRCRQEVPPMKMKLLLVAAVVGLIALAVKKGASQREEWQGLTEAEARSKVADRLPGRMPDEKRDAVTDKIVGTMREADAGVLADDVRATSVLADDGARRRRARPHRVRRRVGRTGSPLALTDLGAPGRRWPPPGSPPGQAAGVPRRRRRGRGRCRGRCRGTRPRRSRCRGRYPSPGDNGRRPRRRAGSGRTRSPRRAADRTR